MGNGLFTCKGCGDVCYGPTHVEINNNVYSNYSDIKLDKAKSQQRIITNIFMPNCKLEFSPENSDNNKIEKNNISTSVINYPFKKRKIQSDKCFNKINAKENDTKNNFTHLFKEAINADKNLTFVSPSISLSTNIIKENNNNNNKVHFNDYNLELVDFLNKLRKNTKIIIEDIDNMIKNNLKIIDNKEVIISDKTKEMIRVNVPFDKIKETLDTQEPIDCLKLNRKLKIRSMDNVDITDKKINDLIIKKKKEIKDEYPECYFYPTFIKDIKINVIFLLAINNIKDKIFNKDIKEFYASTFNEKNNRFFSILCFA
jgi:hypothetical protein